MKLRLKKQHDESDCAAACLEMILDYYGKSVNLRKLRTDAGTDILGTTGYGISVCAEKNGLSCKAFSAPDKSMINQIPFPAIFHIRENSREHYVVVSNIKNGTVKIFDPADGIVKKDLADFLEIWTGIFFLCHPQKDFDEDTEFKTPFSRFLSLLKPHKDLLIKIVFSSMIITVFGILISFYFRFLIDEVLYSEIKSTLNLCSICYLLVLVFQGLLLFCRNQISVFLGSKLEVTLICDFFNHLLRLPLSFFTTRKTGEILSRIRDTEIIRNTISATTVSILVDSIMLIFGGTVMFKMGKSLLYVSMIPVLISALIVWLSASTFKRLIKNRAIAEADKNASMYESINGIATIKALSTESSAFRRNEIKVVDSINQTIKLNSFANLNGTIQNFISSIGTLLIYWIGSFKIFSGEISLGQLISFTTLSSFFLGPLSRLLTMQPNLQEAFVAAERLNDVMEIDEEMTDKKAIEKAFPLQNQIEFKDVSFSYSTREKAISKINFTIKKGEKIAFVGMSGSGKSTLLKLLMKFYKPEEGKILFDSKDISKIKTDEFRNLIGYVPQETLLFSGSIAENIAWGNDYFTSENIVKSAQSAQALDFIMNLPENFKTFVGENGATLSGGEKQRISLARILMRNPQILILDEATASLDSISEKAIMKTVNEMEGRTIIMVAHRLSTISNCDRIFVMNEGEIAECGTHKELLKKNGIYRKLWKAQYEE